MTTLHIRRRRVGDTTIEGIRRYDQHCAANDECERDALRAARGLLFALALSAVIWIVCGGLLWWAVELLAE